MRLSASTRLGPYEIIAPIGSGGMGEVYRARDTRLNRAVAIKFSNEQFTDRFEAEARAVAALSHPNICALFDVGPNYLVMELIEGETLAQRIQKGPLPLKEALALARQLTEALEAAHEKGIVHRDLKPANIKIQSNGTLKVLDFGLAKMPEQTASSESVENSPTLATQGTCAGQILGTAPYLSPEQARGNAVDRRSDIWAFGCVLYEMITGEPAFKGGTISDIIAAVLTKEPDLSKLPAQVRTVIGKCLRKDLRMRWQAIGDVRIALEEDASPVTERVRHSWFKPVAWIGAAGVVSALVFLVGTHRNQHSAAELMRVSINPPESTVFSGVPNATCPAPQIVISSDGRTIVFGAVSPEGQLALWTRSLNDLTAHRLPGTENAEDPCWSPDSRWIAFVVEGKLKKTPASGGPVQTIVSVGSSRGISWGKDDTILFTSAESGVARVASSGGPVTEVTKLDVSRQEGSHRWPQFLPDGRHFLYGVRSSLPQQSGIYAGSLDGSLKKLLVPTESSGSYAAPGFLLHTEGDMLVAQAFDAKRLEFSGQPFAVAEGIGHSSTGYSAFSASDTGVLAYAGPILRFGQLIWYDRAGRTMGPVGAPGDYIDLRLSPNGRELAASLRDPKSGNTDIWLTDIVRGSTSHLTSGYILSASPVWSSDGRRIIYRSVRKGVAEFYEKSANGGGKDESVLSDLTRGGGHAELLTLVPSDWSSDRRHLLYSAVGANTQLWLLPLSSAGGDGKPAKLLDSPANNMQANFSPDGHLIAYTSDESGKWQVQVQTFPLSDRKWQISTDGGYEPRWSADGHEIFYLSEDRKLMSVSVGPGPSFQIPKVLFQTRVFPGVTSTRTSYVPSPDGRRFLINTKTGDAPLNPITVILSWTAASNN
jgi:serine/threonine protein kinase